MAKKSTSIIVKVVKIALTAPFFTLWYLIAVCLPYKLQMKFGTALGRFAASFSFKRRKIAHTNISLCFPEMSSTEREKLLKKSMESLGKGFMESGIAWFWRCSRLRNYCTIEGLEHLEQAKAQGQGVVFLAIHFTSIEICAALINMNYSIDGFYRKHKNPLYEFIQCKGRTRRNCESRVIPKTDTRGIIRALRNGRVVNYAADQDFGRGHSVFAPFFGIPTATVTAPFTLARLGNAKIIPYTTKRLDNDEGYKITIYPPLEWNCHGDQTENVGFLNQFIEDRIRENPEQYLWVHRRFKTRPVGEPSLYDFTKKPDRVIEGRH